MEAITILNEKFLDASEYTLARCQVLPKGYLYEINQDLNIFQILKSFGVEYQDIYKEITKAINSFYIVDENSIWLDELLSTYGLPNVIFPVLSNAKDKALAINMMRYLKTLNSVESYQAFFQLLGYNVSFYLFGDFQAYFIIPTAIPTGIGGGLPKEKLTYLVYVEENVIQNATEGIPSSIPTPIYAPSDNLSIVRRILDFVKPDFIIFKYITFEERKSYNL